MVLISSVNNKGLGSFKDKLISAVGCFFLVIKPLFFLARIMRVHFRNMANTNKQKKNHSSFTSLYVHICNIQRDSCLSKYDIPLFFCNLFSFCIPSEAHFCFLQISKALRLKARDLWIGSNIINSKIQTTREIAKATNSNRFNAGRWAKVLAGKC